MAGYLVATIQLPALAQSWGQYKQLAIDATAQKHDAEAEAMWTQALQLSRADASPGVRYIQSQAGYAAACARQGKTEQAETAYKELLSMRDSGYSGDDLNQALTDYANWLESLKRVDEAAAVRKKLTPTPQVVAHPKEDQEHNIVAKFKALINEGDNELAAHHPAKAETIFKQALTTARAQSEKNEMVAEALDRLIRLYYSTRQYDRAEPYYKASVAIVAAEKGRESLEYFEALMGHAKLLRMLNRKSEAIAEEGLAERQADAAGLIASDSGAGGGGGEASSSGNHSAGFDGSGFTFMPSSPGRSNYSGKGYAFNKGKEVGLLMKQFKNLEW